MKELALKYGCNPNQKPSRIYMEEGELPIEVINGRPGYINFLDAFNSWQLVRELKAATGLPAAASFKHVSPAGAAVGLPLDETLSKIYFVDDLKVELSPIACAYARARGADRMSSYGDFVALSDTCDEATALLIKREVSDGVIAPDYTPEAIEILKAKRKGTYNVIKIDPNYVPEPIERKQVFGITFEQGRNEVKLDDPALFENIPTKNKNFSDAAKRDLILALITLYATSRTDRLSVSEQASRAVFTVHVSQATRRTSGGCASIRKLCHCPSWIISAVQTATILSTYISLRITTTYCAKAHGSSSLRRSLKCSLWRRRRNGWIRWMAYPFPPMHSSPLGITSTEPPRVE